ncbi:MAG: DUF2127 domain-containing protein [Rudaea sp.]|uniref:DUF2127 domain-containing protein n=1 Tax=Rudaea sp. TaxID=2136325 RepID=UPI0039E37862
MAAGTGGALRAIAVYKFAKGAALLVLAAVAFRLVCTPSLEHLANWVAQLPLRSGHVILIRWADQLLGLTPRNFELIGIGASAYAALFLVEGWGLWWRKRWAEYLTVFATASLVPFEAWEIHHHFTWLKVLALAVNVAIVVYLWRIVRKR